MQDLRTVGSFTNSTDPQCVNIWSTLSWNSNTCQKLTWRTASWKTSQFFRWDSFDNRDLGHNLISLSPQLQSVRLNRIMANSMHLLNISDLQFLFQIVHDISPNVFSKYALCGRKILVSRSRPGGIAPLCLGRWIEMSFIVAASSTQETPEKWMLISLQVITNRDTQETLLCTAYVFEVSTSEHGAQHHMYKLVKE